MIEDALQKVIRHRLLAAEAKKRNITVDELVAIQVDSAVTAATDKAIVQFYNENKAQMQGSLAENATNIREYLSSVSRQTVLDTFVAKLSAEYGVKSFVEPERIHIITDGQPSKGTANAPVTLVEFADF